MLLIFLRVGGKLNLIILEEEDFITENIVRLSGRRYNHMMEIHKVKKGQKLIIGKLNGKMGSGEVLDINDEEIDMKVNLNQNPPKPLSIKIIMAMPRPKVFKRIIRDLTSMGIKEIYIIKTWKVEKSFWNSPVLSEKVLKDSIILGLEQGKDTIMPKIEIFKRFKPFIEDDITGIIEGTKALVADPFSEKREIKDFENKPITLAIGPEGGFIEYEINMFKKYGFEDLNLGDRILRVETVLPYLIGKFS